TISVLVPHSGLPGNYTLTFNGATTTPLTWDPTDPTPGPNTTSSTARIAAALNALPTIGGVGGSVSVAQGGNEVQTLSVAGAAGAGFPLIYVAPAGAAQPTATRPVPATAAQIAAALGALPGIGTQPSGAPNVLVTGASGGPYTVTFVGGPASGLNLNQLQ